MASANNRGARLRNRSASSMSGDPKRWPQQIGMPEPVSLGEYCLLLGEGKCSSTVGLCDSIPPLHELNLSLNVICSQCTANPPRTLRLHLCDVLSAPDRCNCFARDHDLACLICTLSTASRAMSGTWRKERHWQLTCPIVGQVNKLVNYCTGYTRCSVLHVSSLYVLIEHDKGRSP